MKLENLLGISVTEVYNIKTLTFFCKLLKPNLFLSNRYFSNNRPIYETTVKMCITTSFDCIIFSGPFKFESLRNETF